MFVNVKVKAFVGNVTLIL